MKFKFNNESKYLTYEEAISNGIEYFPKTKLENLFKIGLDIMECLRIHKLQQYSNNMAISESIVNILKNGFGFTSHEQRYLGESLKHNTHGYVDEFIYDEDELNYHSDIRKIDIYSEVFAFSDGYLNHAFVDDIMEVEILFGEGTFSSLEKMIVDLDNTTVTIILSKDVECVISLYGE